MGLCPGKTESAIDPFAGRESTRRHDFRDKAVRSSNQALSGLDTDRYLAAGRSVIIPVKGRLIRLFYLRERLQWVMAIGGEIGFGASLIVGELMFLLFFDDYMWSKSIYFGMWVMVVSIMSATFFWSWTGLPLLTARLIRSLCYARRDTPIRHNAGLRRFLVALEDANTCTRLKMYPEDAGLLILDPGNRRIVIEGLSHRYVIHHKDVVELRTGPWAIDLIIGFRVGDATLRIAVTRLSALKQLPLIVGIRFSPDIKRVTRILGPLCDRCGYDLRATVQAQRQTCPECGTATASEGCAA